MAEHPIQGLMGVTIDKIREMVDTSTIIGDPIRVDAATTIIPVSRVTFGFTVERCVPMWRPNPTSRCLAAEPVQGYR